MSPATNDIDFSTDPISNIRWIKADTLEANSYNPNVVFTPEMRLLEFSLLRQGWIQPVLISRDNIIIDGFHRWKLSQDSAALMKKYLGMVPCVVLDIDRAHAMLLTVRINRAKGTHVAVRMAEMVKELIDKHGLDRQQIAREIGGTLDEVDLLYQDGIFKARNLKDYAYSQAWYPKETRQQA